MAMYKLCFYVPETHLQLVKESLFEQGAGKIGNYDCYAWQVLGSGQFKPGEGSQPFLGKHGTVEQVSEYKVEMVCDEQYIEAVISTLKKVHPYETPAYDVMQLIEI